MTIKRSNNALVFSNARNAASGILLRKESNNNNNDDNHSRQQQRRDLRQKLRFYAYDIVVSNDIIEKNDSILVIDGIQARELLPILGFTVPEPVVTTTLTCLSQGGELH